MKDHSRSLVRLLAVPVLTLALICSVAAQSTTLKGSFGYLLNTALPPTTSDSGTSIVGVINFDSAPAALPGTYIFQRGANNGRAASTSTGTLTGAYSVNPDGTSTVTLALDAGLTATFAIVIADVGQSLQMVETHLDGGDAGGEVLSGVARAAHPGSLKGSYAFELNNSPIPAVTLGVMSFDGAGAATVSFTSVGVGKDPSQPPVMTGTFTGTYSINPDGSGTMNLAAGGQFAMVVTDGGSGLLLLLTSDTTSNVSSGTARLQ